MHFLNAHTPLCPRGQHPPIVKYTRLTAIFLLFGFLQVSAAGYAQKVTIFGDNLTLKAIFKSIEKQTDLVFMYDETILDDTKTVSIHMTDAAVTDVLDKCLKDQPVLYTTTGKTIFIKKKLPSLIADIPERQAVEHRVGGVVKNESGMPLEGASILLVQLKRTSLTNNMGEFIFQGVPEGTYNVEISFIGFETYKTVAVVKSSDAFFNAFLKQIVNNLDETVVKGYYNTSKRLNTGNVSIVKGDELQKQPISDPVIALEGRVPGLYISQNSGIPGSSLNIIRLRGQNSIANGNNPLFIVDGIPFPSTSLTSTAWGGGATSMSPFNSLNPNDIQSVEILKDADATSIYGSRGANGVILITTKKATSNKTELSLNAYSGIGEIGRKMNLLNTAQYISMRREAFSNDGLTPNSTAYDINGKWDTTRYTDWQKLLIGGQSVLNSINAVISGGSQFTHFSISGGYRYESAVFPGNFYDKKGTINLHVSHVSADKKFSVGINAGYINDNNKIPTSDLTAKITLAPDAPQIYNSNGTLNWQNSTWTNPLAILSQSAKALTKNIYANLNLEYELIPNLKLSGKIGYNNIQMDQRIIFPLNSFNPINANVSSLRKLQLATTKNENTIFEPQINYHLPTKNGYFDFLAGSTFQQQQTSSIAISGSDYTSDNIIENIIAARTVYIGNNVSTIYKYVGLYGRINYNFNDRYVLNLTGRRDGSSRFGPSKRFGNFGALGAAWLFTNENFFEPLKKYISTGKVRVSYGLAGNDQLPDYQYLSSYTPDFLAYQGITGLFPTQLTNVTFSWEQVKKLEVGIELGLFKDQVVLTASYYRHRTGNQLVGFSLPAITGFESIQANLPAVIQNTGLEIEIQATPLNKSDFKWSISGNITIPRTKLISYPNLSGSPYANRYIVGQSLFISKRFQNTGVDPQTGLYKFFDYNKDGKITNPDDLQYLANTAQNYFGGVSNSFSYKSFSLDFFVQYVNQQARDYLSYFQKPGSFNNNQPTFILDRWQKPGDNSSIQKFSNSNGQANTAFSQIKNSNMLYSDGSFIRFKNISLSYMLPQKFIKTAKLSNARIYAQIQNLFTITKYQGLDPETQGLVLPPLRVFVFGVQLLW